MDMYMYMHQARTCQKTTCGEGPRRRRRLDEERLRGLSLHMHLGNLKRYGLREHLLGPSL
jgi:hypothetical protein